MDTNNAKCVMIIDEALPLGIVSNTAAVLGMTLGKHFPDIVGTDVTDKSGIVHIGITEIPIPILKGSTELIREIRQRLCDKEFEDVTSVDFSDMAQSCKTYDEFVKKIAETEEIDLRYLGIGIFGVKKKINKLTGNIPLLK